MPRYHAVLIDECGCEFGANVDAPTHEVARDQLRENYPESRVVQLESPRDTQEREHLIYTRMMEEDY